MKRGRFTGEPIIGYSWKFKALITADRGVGVCLPAARKSLGLKQKHQAPDHLCDDRGF